MASRKAFPQRLLNICRISTQSLTNCRVSSSMTTMIRNRSSRIQNRTNIAPPDPGDSAIFSRFLHRKASPPATMSPEFRSLPTGESLMEKIKEIGIAKDRLRLDGLAPPPETSPAPERQGFAAEAARKLLRISQLEAVKSRLRETERSWISYGEFVRICEEASSSSEDGRSFAKKLDESGNVVVFGDVVLLKPEQVVKAINDMMTEPPQASPGERRELEELERQKSEIDRNAESLVRRELWLGLAYLVVQTAGFMRLTFWELTWDVMEPICFYVTSAYFMAGYAFFLRTSKEPSFEGFFQSRFGAKQRKLMARHGFDAARLRALREACHAPERARVGGFLHDP